METDRYTDDAKEYMNILLEAGFTMQSALERTFDYLLFALSAPHLSAAKAVRKAAIQLGIDYKSQSAMMMMSSRA